MSHIVDGTARMPDTAAIARACTRLEGWEFMPGQQTYHWNGHWVDDSPVPRNLFDEQAEYDRVVAMTRPERQAYMNALLGKCDHAIKVPGTSYEIGLIKKKDGYMPIWDWWGMRTAMSSDGGKTQDGGPLLQAYAVEAAKLAAVKAGYPCTETVGENGKIVVTLHPWS